MATEAAFILDLDDTLYLEADYVASGFQSLEPYVADRFGVTGFFAKAWTRFSAGDRGTIFNQVLTDANIQFGKEDIIDMIEHYRSHAPTIALQNDAATFLNTKKHEHGFGLITDGPIVAQSAKIMALGIREKFDPIIMTDAWGVDYRKPHQRAFLAIMNYFSHLDARYFVYIGDNPRKDFIAPKQLGWWTVRIRRADGLYAAEPEGTAGMIDRTIASFDELEIDKLTLGVCP